jgi:NADPH:quinone reductase-like Zn-dependent oxidoreductase
MVLFRIATCLLAILPSTVAFARTSTTRAFIRPSVLSTANTPTLTTAAASFTNTRTTTSLTMSDSDRYSLPDQPARFAKAKAENNERFLDITTVYDSSFLKGKRVAVTGANRGIGLELAKELTEAGAQVVAIVRSSSEELDALKPAEIVKGIELTDDAMCGKLAGQIKGGPIDIVSTV